MDPPRLLEPTHLDYSMALCKHLYVLDLQSCVFQRSPHRGNRGSDPTLLQSFNHKQKIKKCILIKRLKRQFLGTVVWPT